MREGRFQRQVAIVTGVSALLSGFEAYYSHYKNNFRYWVQWTPVVLAPVLAGTAFASVKSRRLATTALPAVSALAGADAAVGFYYHARGVLRRPGGSKHLLYNIMYGPPIFAPLLFGAAGMLGVLASLLRQEAAMKHDYPAVDPALCPRDAEHRRSAAADASARLLPRLQHTLAEPLLGRRDAQVVEKRVAASTGAQVLFRRRLELLDGGLRSPDSADRPHPRSPDSHRRRARSPACAQPDGRLPLRRHAARPGRLRSASRPSTRRPSIATVANFLSCRTCSRIWCSRRSTTASQAAPEIWKQMSVHASGR